MSFYSVRTGNPRNCLATQGQGCCDMSGTPARQGETASLTPPSPQRWTEPPLPDPNESRRKKAAESCSRASPTQTSGSTQGWTSWHQVPGKAGGRTVPSCWDRACSTGRWGISIKKEIVNYTNALQFKQGCRTGYSCSSFWPPPKPDVTAQGTILYSSVFLWTVIYSSQQLFFVAVVWLVGFAFAFFRVFCWFFLGFSFVRFVFVGGGFGCCFFFFFNQIPRRDQRLISFRRAGQQGCQDCK